MDLSKRKPRLLKVHRLQFVPTGSTADMSIEREVCFASAATGPGALVDAVGAPAAPHLGTLSAGHEPGHESSHEPNHESIHVTSPSGDVLDRGVHLIGEVLADLRVVVHQFGELGPAVLRDRRRDVFVLPGEDCADTEHAKQGTSGFVLAK